MSQTTSVVRKEDLFKDVETSFSPVQGPGSAVSLCPAGAAPVPTLASIAQQLNAGGERDPVIRTIRDVGATRPLSGALHAADVDENRWAFEQARKILKNVGSDVVLGLERGGKLLSETTLAGMDAPKPVLETVLKKDVKVSGDAMVKQMKALVESGKKNLSMVDVNMGGGSYGWIRKQANALMEELRREGKDKGVTVTIIMLSEQFGFPKNVADGVQLKPDGLVPGVTSVFIPVRFVGGDDVDRIAGGDAPGQAADTRPLGVFDNAGHYAPIEMNDQNGKTPREQFIKLMNPPKPAKPQ